MASFADTVEGVVAIDGKVLRRSFDRASGQSALHMVSAWGCEQRLVLAQIATDAKSNEITAVAKLLEMLSLKGTIVTTDAALVHLPGSGMVGCSLLSGFDDPDAAQTQRRPPSPHPEDGVQGAELASL